MEEGAGTRPGPNASLRFEEALSGTWGYARLRSAGEMGELALRTLRHMFTPPFGWWREAVVEGSLAVRRCLVPLTLSHTAYLIGFAIIGFGLGVLLKIGAIERLAGGMWIAWVREVATWITMMIFAGVAGSALTSDLGARKIREELDALTVLGVDRVRSLVVPRVVAMTVAALVVTALSLLLVQALNFLLAPRALDFSQGAFTDNLSSAVLPLDIYAFLVKHAILGFFVGIVACQKGLSASGGTEGVGRAVNQTVVITFFGVWLFNSVFELAYLTIFPELSVLRG